MSGLYRAFGVTWDSDLTLPALPAAASIDDADPPTRILRADARALAEGWPRAGGQRLVAEISAEDGGERTVDRHPDAGLRLRARGFGEALVSADGATVRVAPPDDAGRFERFLVGRILPWTALVRGREVLHAAGIVLDGRAVLLLGPSGVGKTSLAVALTLGGAGFLSDDVVAVDRGADGGLRAHAGARVAGLRGAEQARLGGAARSRLGPLTRLEGKAWAQLDPVSEPLAIAALVFVTRSDRPDGPAVESIVTRDPGLLLASTFVVGLQTPARLRRLLDVSADLAALPQLRARVRPGLEADGLAPAIVDTVRELAPAGGGAG